MTDTASGEAATGDQREDSLLGLEAAIDRLIAENRRLRDEVELWKGRWESERADHQQTMDNCDQWHRDTRE
jgi:hypothetical protein